MFKYFFVLNLGMLVAESTWWLLRGLENPPSNVLPEMNSRNEWMIFLNRGCPPECIPDQWYPTRGAFTTRAMGVVPRGGRHSTHARTHTRYKLIYQSRFVLFCLPRRPSNLRIDTPYIPRPNDLQERIQGERERARDLHRTMIGFTTWFTWWVGLNWIGYHPSRLLHVLHPFIYI